MKIFLLVLLFVLFSYAKIEVAFIEVKNFNKKIIQLEPNGQFAHIAISYKNGWIHAHPLKGVEWINQKELEKMGDIKNIILIADVIELAIDKVNYFLGKPYDSDFSWTDEKIYCSELVAKLLNLQPTPMIFDSSVWPPKYSSHRNELGLSPDDVFNQLLEKGYQSISFKNSCQKWFR